MTAPDPLDPAAIEASRDYYADLCQRLEAELAEARASLGRCDERARINAGYAGKLSAERDEARASLERVSAQLAEERGQSVQLIWRAERAVARAEKAERENRILRRWAPSQAIEEINNADTTRNKNHQS